MDAESNRRHVFISHHHKDDAAVDQMTRLLKKEGVRSQKQFDPRETSESSATGSGPDQRGSYSSFASAQDCLAQTVVVLIGKETHTRPWVDWEIEEANKRGKRIVGVYEQGGTSADVPENLWKYASEIVAWNSDSIIDAIDGSDAPFQSPDGQFAGLHLSQRTSSADLMNSVFIYVVDRDFGFAPNPFHGYCTLATCKAKIRNQARVGDWVIGNGGVG